MESNARAQRVESAVVAAVALSIFLKLLYSARLIAAAGPERLVGRASLASVLCIIAPLLLLPRFWRLPLLMLADAGASIVLVADELYFRRYLDLISPEDLASAPILIKGFAQPVLFHAFRPADLLYGVDLIAFAVALPFVVKTLRQGRPLPLRWRTATAASALAVAAVAAQPLIRLLADSTLTLTEGDRLRAPATMGPLPFHVYDWIRRKTAPPEALPDVAQVRTFLTSRPGRADMRAPSPLAGAASGKNLILIQAESLQGFAVGLVVEGQPVTPNLDAFAKESLRFTNFLDQTHHGFTSDGEFTTLTSLHPMPEGSASVLLRTHHFQSLPQLLVRHGYDTISADADDETTWSMAMMHPNHGFALSLFGDRFVQRERFDLLSDGQFFSQMLPRLSAMPRPFMAFLITCSNHGPPFNIPDRYRTLRLPDRPRGDLIGDYLQSVHYFDAVFGAFIEELRQEGLLDESIVAIYGDHQAYLERTRELARLSGRDPESRYDRWLTDRRMPFLVHLPGGSHAGAVDAAAGHLDIAPTLLGLLGVDDGDRVMLGRDATGGAPPLVVFRNGGFADGEHYYALPDVVNEQPACFTIRDRSAIDCGGLNQLRRRAREELMVSDAILQRDLVPQLVLAAIPKTLQDLPAPRSLSADLTADRVIVNGFDLWAPTPSGAKLSVTNGGAPVRVMFSPIIDAKARGADREGAVFEIWAGGVQLYQRRVAPEDVVVDRVTVPIPPGGSPVSEISLVTRAPSGRVVHSTWQRLRFASD